MNADTLLFWAIASVASGLALVSVMIEAHRRAAGDRAYRPFRDPVLIFIAARNAWFVMAGTVLAMSVILVAGSFLS